MRSDAPIKGDTGCVWPKQERSLLMVMTKVTKWEWPEMKVFVQ
jgi:hypothetical protein